MVIPLKKININPKVKQSNIKISDGSALKVFWLIGDNNAIKGTE
tara:strand:+ start:342 stop:473 length:132 start_codon:yes stop_codon:yes gene_type:complete